MLTTDSVETLETDMAKAPQLNLEDMNGAQLQELIQKAQALKEERKAEKVQELRSRWAAECEEEGIALSDIFPPAQPPSKPRQKAEREPGTRTPARVKYRFPDDTEWSGKGRIPLGARSFLKNAGATIKESGFFEDLELGKLALQKFTVAE
jgi:DNA-binding protein H-NS